MFKKNRGGVLGKTVSREIYQNLSMNEDFNP